MNDTPPNDRPRTERERLAVAGARATTQSVVGGQPRKDVIKNVLFSGLLFLAIVLALAGLAALLIQAFIKGRPDLSLDLLTEPGSSDPTVAGFRQAILGSLMLMAGVIVLIVPLGIGAAVYLEEYGDKDKWWNRLIELNIQNLAGVPSIIYGILGLGFIVRGPLDLGFVAAAGSLTLALLVLPIVIIAGREAIRAVPSSIREGSLALGATKWQTIQPSGAAGVDRGHRDGGDPRRVEGDRRDGAAAARRRRHVRDVRPLLLQRRLHGAARADLPVRHPAPGGVPGPLGGGNLRPAPAAADTELVCDLATE